MNLTLILRDVPVKDDAAYNVLYSLCPHKIIYSVDFGVRAFPYSEGQTTRNYKRLTQKLDALKQIVPFNGASEIAPMFPSYWFSELLDEDIRGYAAGEAFRLFTGVKTVYFDLGVHAHVAAAKEMAETVHRLNPDVGIGVIAPFVEYEKVGELHEWVLGTTNTFPCPFVNGSGSLTVTLDEVTKGLGETAEVFCSNMSEADGKSIAEIAKNSSVGTLVFWSALAAKNVELPIKESCEEPKPAEEPSPFIEMRALYSSMIRDKKSLNDAGIIGHVGVGDSVKVHVLQPNGEGTAFGKVDLGDGKIGYVVVTHFKQQKFAEVEK